MELLTATEILGLIGFVGYMAGFAGQQFSIIDGSGKLYSIINLVSASLVLISLVEQFNLASVMIQISWIIISFIGLIIRLRKKTTTSNTVIKRQENLTT